jgi:hypothetical protein
MGRAISMYARDGKLTYFILKLESPNEFWRMRVWGKRMGLVLV